MSELPIIKLRGIASAMECKTDMDRAVKHTIDEAASFADRLLKERDEARKHADGLLDVIAHPEDGDAAWKQDICKAALRASYNWRKPLHQSEDK